MPARYFTTVIKLTISMPQMINMSVTSQAHLGYVNLMVVQLPPLQTWISMV